MKHLAWLLSLIVLVVAQPASAQDDPCTAAFDEAQTHRAANELVAAKDALIRCAQAECPAPLIKQCTTWHQEVERDIPGFIITAKDGDGRDLVAVRVTVNGKLLTERLSGTELRLDPGAHTLRFEVAGNPPVEQNIVLRVGERRRNVEVVIGAPSAQPDAPPSPPPLPPERGWQPNGLFWAGIAITGVGLAVGAIVGGITLSDTSKLEDQCETTGCTADEISSVETVSHISTVGFAVAGVGAILTIVGAVVGMDTPDDTPMARRGLFLRF